MDEYGIKLLTPKGLLHFLTTQCDHQHFVVAYSGGVDSHVLLDIMAQAVTLNPELQVSAIHIHHGLNVKADSWAKHCENVCHELQVPIKVIKVNAAVYDGRSPEEVAREARFLAFEQHLEVSQCLLLAHHAEDQAETILLRLFRGAGPNGLSGMSIQSMLGKNKILRPLLTTSKQSIVEYAKQRQLHWIEDDSNQDLRFDRNFLRQDIIPKLMQRWPGMLRSVNRTGALCLETRSLVETLAKQDFDKVQGKTKDALSVTALLSLDSRRRRGVIRYWLRLLNCLPPSRDHMARIEREVLEAKPDRHPKLKLGDYEIRRCKKELVVAKLEPVFCR